MDGRPQLSIHQTDNGSGLIASRYGIRGYYTVEAARGIDKLRETDAEPPYRHSPRVSEAERPRTTGEAATVRTDVRIISGRHSLPESYWQSDPEITIHRTASHRAASHPSSAEKDTSMTAAMRREVSRKTQSLPNINQSGFLNGQVLPAIRSNHGEKENVSLPHLSLSSSLTGQQLSGYRNVTLGSSHKPVLILQEEEQRPASTHIYYGRHGEPIPHPPSQIKLPYCLPPIGSSSEPIKSNGRRPLRIHAHLEFGYITDDLKTEKLPDSVLEELLKEYGHLKNTEVVIVRKNGTYTIHSRPVRRTTSDGFLLKHSQLLDEDEEDGLRTV